MVETAAEPRLRVGLAQQRTEATISLRGSYRLGDRALGLLYRPHHLANRLRQFLCRRRDVAVAHVEVTEILSENERPVARFVIRAAADQRSRVQWRVISCQERC